jgi:AbiV family abortive infection protein
VTTADQLKETLSVCFANARNLLRAAKRVLEDERLPNIAFDLAIRALEEVGKAALVGARHLAVQHGDDGAFADKRLDDHVFKIFWALWTPIFARGKISREDFEGSRWLAKRLHETRLAAMYVGVGTEPGTLSLAEVGEDMARWAIEITETRLGMEQSREWQDIDLTPGSNAHWLMVATEDPAKRALIFGEKSFAKLAELGDVRAWHTWVRKQFEEAEAAGQEALRSELQRAVPLGDDMGDEKWRFRIRLYSPSQSIRKSAIKTWNEMPTWIKLSTVDGKAHALDVDLTLRERVAVQTVGMVGLDAARMFVSALNIGSMGFWWWELSSHVEKFYEKISDLKSAEGASFEVTMFPGPRFEWVRQALKAAELQRVGLCLGMMAALGRPQYHTMVDPYFQGLALIAKSDLLLAFGPSASERFGTCLLEAMRHFGDWDGTEEAIGSSLSTFLAPLNAPPSDVDEMAALLRRTRHPPVDAAISLERAAVLKSLCDAYLRKNFENMAAARIAKKSDEDLGEAGAAQQ